MSLGNLIDSPLSRRVLLIGAGAATGFGMAGLTPSLASGATPATLPGADDPEQCLKNYIKMTSDLSGKPIFGWQQGLLYGSMPGQMIKPLLGMVGFGCGSIEAQKDGTYHSLWKEVLYYTDLKTGEVIDSWVNPYNNATCEVLHVHNASVNMVLKAHLPDYAAIKEKTGNELGYSSVQTEQDPDHPYFLQTAVAGDTVTLFSDARGYVHNPLDPKTWPRESTGEYYSVGEFYMNCGSLKALLDKKVTNVPSTGTWNRLAAWLPWMLMGGQQGQLFYMTTTKKLGAASELPAYVRNYTEKHYPDFLTPPTDFNVPMESSWDVYKRERKPAPPL
jgi:hypothetical protein